MKEKVRKKRYRNNPSIRMIILEYLAKHPVASFGEICSHVIAQPIKLTSKTPRNSIFCVLVRMDNVERVSHGNDNFVISCNLIKL